MSNLKRKMINCEKTFDVCVFEGRLNPIIKLLTDFRKDVGETAFLSINSTERWGDLETEIQITWQRDETNEEYEKRCKTHYTRSAAAKKANGKRRKQKEIEERAMLVDLKAKYEGN